LLQENLLDVSHISFLHEGGFDTGAICTAEPTVSIENGRIRIDREVEEVVVGAYAATFELPDGTRFKRLLRSQSWAPCLNVITNIFWEVDRPDAPPRIIHAIFPITPKTNNSLHYFMASSKNYGIEVIPDSIKQAVWDIFLTDKAAIESIQRSYDLLGSNTPEVSVRADVAALRYRDLVANLVKAESAA
jgi:vanillate O-demethylase monooxygenase subunit